MQTPMTRRDAAAAGSAEMAAPAQSQLPGPPCGRRHRNGMPCAWPAGK
ncbi:MAG: hypothetical protein EOL90_02820 [Spartobacteria bacterium]|nr:hypothetical protein [Spartobacteria bacterium]